MSDFAVWLKNLNPTHDPELQALQDFAKTNAPDWPYGSNDVGDYIPVITAHAVDANRNALLAALARYFAAWKQTGQTAPQGFWAGIVAKAAGARWGVFSLGLFGLLIAVILTYGIFYGNFLGSIAKPEQARGLITFLFSVSTIAIFLLITIALYWDNAQVEERFNRAKELLTLMIGIFGTILGFYFGSLTNPTSEGAIRLANIEVPNVVVAPGDKTMVTATVLGGTAPITYDLYFSDPTGTVKTETLTVKDKAANGGAISQSVTIPAEVTKPASVTYTLVAAKQKATKHRAWAC
jgi:hypothetical protein